MLKEQKNNISKDPNKIHPIGSFREIDQVYEPDFGKIDEDFVQKIWNTQRFINAELLSIDGKEIRVLKPGVWNREEGPDFMHAEIELNGKLLVGDVEIHVKASEWYTHKHHLNSRYNRVVLHTVFYNDDFNLRTRLQNGKRISTLELLKWIDAPIGDLYDETHQEELQAEDYCRVTGQRLDLEKLKHVFEALGTERFLEKADAIRLLRTRLDFEQILYEGIMEALGYTQNSKPLRELSQRVPFADFDHKSVEEIQAILFGVAGLLPSQTEKPLSAIEKEDPFVVTLEKIWQTSKRTVKAKGMDATQWHFGRIRPYNYPTRRIAAMSQLIHKSSGSLMMYFLPTCEKAAMSDTDTFLRNIRKELLNLLILEPEGYWETHANFGKGGTRKVKLIGDKRALDIMVNKILPVAYVWAVESESKKLQEAILNIYSSSTKLQENRIFSQVESQIFSEAQPMHLIKPTAQIQQGTMRLYKNFCADQLCDLCPILDNNAILLHKDSD
ncbi:DUF2851 family protein [Candidatus Poribacteria bacterium]|nr:DUF2851 family protein [Candidatus Poribacteria bacterium]